jgi:malate dehydrogenase (oxaloacetate-decarboxylating)
LGIGDQGYGGIAISIGKLALYTLGGLAPYHALPVSLDVGTDRTELRDDPLYLGFRQERIKGQAYLDLLDRFVDCLHARYPHAILQWEDLAKDTAFDVLERYRKKHPSFNDDIQGTGAVAVAGLVRASAVCGKRLEDQVFVVHGAGAGGGGVALAIRDALVDEGLSPASAYERIFVLDSKGLLTEGRDVEAYKRPFLKPRALSERFSGQAGKLPDLAETIVGAKATAIIGLSGQAGAFDEHIVALVQANAERPIVFALSNPTAISEAKPEDVLRWTEGRALVATGSPFADVVLGGVTYPIGQGNNAFIFPGLGFGAQLAQVHEVTTTMVLAASRALATYTATNFPDRLYPPIAKVGEAADHVAVAVIEQAYKDRVANIPRDAFPADLSLLVAAARYQPEYRVLDMLPGAGPEAKK